MGSTESQQLKHTPIDTAGPHIKVAGQTFLSCGLIDEIMQHHARFDMDPTTVKHIQSFCGDNNSEIPNAFYRITNRIEDNMVTSDREITVREHNMYVSQKVTNNYPKQPNENAGTMTIFGNDNFMQIHINDVQCAPCEAFMDPTSSTTSLLRNRLRKECES